MQIVQTDQDPDVIGVLADPTFCRSSDTREEIRLFDLVGPITQHVKRWLNSLAKTSWQNRCIKDIKRQGWFIWALMKMKQN